MLIVDAINITSGGGLVLLKYLASALRDSGAPYRIVSDLSVVGLDLEGYETTHCTNTFLSRWRFYQDVEQVFEPTTVFCFGNFPPSQGLSCNVITYFHRPALANMNLDLISTTQRIEYFFKQLLLRAWLKNSDLFLFQSTLIERHFKKVYGQEVKSAVIPFYDSKAYQSFLLDKDSRLKKINRFIYVSNDAPHKNHGALLKAWELLNDTEIHPVLILTLPANSRFLPYIKRLNKKGCKILNLGQVNHDTVLQETLNSTHVIFPSLAETLGLGLVEGVILGCKVVAADLKYTYEVVRPSYTFVPSSPKSICSTVQAVLNDASFGDKTTLRLNNNISDLLDLLTKSTP